MSDPIRALQAAACSAAVHVAPGEPARRVVVYGAGGGKLLDVAVPAECPPAGDGPGTAAAGWVVTDRGAWFDGEPVPVKGRSLDVLRVLAAAPGPVGADELRAAWGGYGAEESTVRWQVNQLKKLLKARFPDFEGDPVAATGSGYLLALR